jgi:hypothetical protein
MKIFPAIVLAASIVAGSPAFAHGGGGGMGRSMGGGNAAQMTSRQAIGVPAQASVRGAIRGQKAERGMDRNRASTERQIARLEKLQAAIQNKLRWGAGAQRGKDLTEIKRIGQEIARLQTRGTAGESTRTAL